MRRNGGVMSPHQGERLISERYPPKRPPVVLIVNAQEWSTRALESILWPSGYAVIRAYTGRQALDRVRSSRPDLIIIDTNLPDFDSQELCSAIRAEATVLDSTPILMTAPDRPSRELRLGSLRAGAWDFLDYPLDAEELMLRLDSFMRAKFDADHAREKALVDESTGLYNIRGLERRAAELGSHAFRYHWPLACVVVTPDVADRESLPVLREAVRQIAASSREVFRTSDAVGRLGESEFAIIAPGTDAEGAVKLAERLATALNGSSGAGRPALQLRAGYQAVSDYHENPIAPMEMLAHASTALHDESVGGAIRAVRSSVH
jgi:diguanylate cyclase (GGDEF)-like protein